MSMDYTKSGKKPCYLCLIYSRHNMYFGAKQRKALMCLLNNTFSHRPEVEDISLPSY